MHQFDDHSTLSRSQMRPQSSALNYRSRCGLTGPVIAVTLQTLERTNGPRLVRSPEPLAVPTRDVLTSLAFTGKVAARVSRSLGSARQSRRPESGSLGPMMRRLGPAPHLLGSLTRPRTPLTRPRGPLARLMGPLARSRGPMIRSRGPLARSRGPGNEFLGPRNHFAGGGRRVKRR